MRLCGDHLMMMLSIVCGSSTFSPLGRSAHEVKILIDARATCRHCCVGEIIVWATVDSRYECVHNRCTVYSVFNFHKNPTKFIPIPPSHRQTRWRLIKEGCICFIRNYLKMLGLGHSLSPLPQPSIYTDAGLPTSFSYSMGKGDKCAVSSAQPVGGVHP